MDTNKDYFTSSKYNEKNTYCITLEPNSALFDEIISRNEYLSEPIHLTFVVDISSSMREFLVFDDTRISKIDIVKKSIIDALTVISPFSKYRKIFITLLTFNTATSVVFQDIELNSMSINNVIKSVELITALGGTFMHNAFDKLSETLNTCVGIDKKFIFFMTDGYNNDGEKYNDKMVLDVTTSNNYKTNKYIGIGLGSITDYDSELMKSLFKDKLYCCPNAQTITETIIGLTFTNFIQVFQDINVSFPDSVTADYEITSTINESNKTYYLSQLSMSQVLLFALSPKSDSKLSYPQINIEFTYNNKREHITLTPSEKHIVLDKEYTKNYFELLNKFNSYLSKNTSKTPSKKVLDEARDIETEIKNSLPEYEYHTRDMFCALLARVSSYCSDYEISINHNNFDACTTLLASSAAQNMNYSNMSTPTNTTKYARFISDTTVKENKEENQESMSPSIASAVGFFEGIIDGLSDFISKYSKSTKKQ